MGNRLMELSLVKLLTNYMIATPTHNYIIKKIPSDHALSFRIT